MLPHELHSYAFGYEVEILIISSDLHLGHGIIFFIVLSFVCFAKIIQTRKKEENAAKKRGFGFSHRCSAFSFFLFFDNL